MQTGQTIKNKIDVFFGINRASVSASGKSLYRPGSLATDGRSVKKKSAMERRV